MFAANVTFPSASTLNGPLVTGVTLVLVVETGTPFSVSANPPLFATKTLPTTVGVVPDGTVGVAVTGVSSFAIITLFAITSTVAKDVEQIVFPGATQIV